MSAEQTPKAAEQVATQLLQEQATNPNLTTKPAKNPKRVAAGKAVAGKTRKALEAQKKALAEAEIIIANHNAKKAPYNHPSADADASGPKGPQGPQGPQGEEGPQGDGFSNPGGLSTTQWLAVGSIVVSLIGIYYNREEIKAALKPRVREKSPNAVEESASQAAPMWRSNSPQRRTLQEQPRKGIWRSGGRVLVLNFDAYA